ncbi:MAG: hypothetical protein HY708_02135, partial [Ignavibacteriae bacterium]|nr:hypothetical protein [Ignavibacteriota bacterium]
MKQLFAVLAALLMVSTLAFSQNMQRGDFSGDLNSEGWTLSTGVGVRSQIIFVSFSKPFDSTPELVLTLT